MRKNLTSCSCFKIFILAILFHFITCDCSFPKRHFPNGHFVYEKRNDENKTVAEEFYILRFECYIGYQRIGSRFMQCVEGKWSDVVPVCAKMQCRYPPLVENAEFRLHSGIDKLPTLGSFVVYTCKVGYELEDTNASKLYCNLNLGMNQAIWKGKTPVCRKKQSCPDPGVSKYGFRKGKCCFSGDIVQYSCKDNYELIGNEKIECLRFGNWSSRRPLCKPLRDHCEFPPPISHGVVAGYKDGDYFMPYDEVEVICEPGYKHKGPTQFVMCEEGGEWEDEFGECIEIFCDLPEPLTAGTIPELLTTNLTSFHYGYEITYLCDEGYRLVGGDSWRTCGKNGWSGKTPHCEVIQCPDPGVLENGFVIGDNFHIGAKVRFKCFTGYQLLGSFERYCKPNGQWSGELSRCDNPSNYCPNPGIPINGYKNSTSYDVGDKVGFQCQSGYIQIGSKVRECFPNRTWSGTETKCLGPYDFDNTAHVRDFLQVKLAEKAEEQEKEIQKYQEALHVSWYNDGIEPIGRILDVGYPGRLFIYFAFDVSGSVGKYYFDKSIEFAKAIVKRVGISEDGARAGALTFSSKAENKFLPLQLHSTEDVIDALDKLNYTGGGTAASSALHLIRENMFLDEGNLQTKKIKTVVFILTDGKANMGGSPEVEANILKEAGVEIYCIGITGSIEKESLYKIASTDTDSNGERPNVFILENYLSMSWLIQEITNGTVDYSQCGLEMENVRNEGGPMRILNGNESKAWPWMAALYMPVDKANPFNAELRCGGSIINNYFILTAAHCLYNMEGERRNKKHIIVKLGLTDIKNESYVQEFEVSEMFIHPLFKLKVSFDYDIALLLLEKPIEYNPFVRPVCLPPIELTAESPLYNSREYAWAAGWGHEGIIPAGSKRPLKTSQVLKELLLPLQSRQRCLQSLMDNKIKPSHFTDRMFCAGDGNKGSDTCQGDSGGPLMQSQLNSDGYLYWTQIGIVSWGIGCGIENTYGYYTHVQKLRSWIDATLDREMAAMQ